MKVSTLLAVGEEKEWAVRERWRARQVGALPTNICEKTAVRDQEEGSGKERGKGKGERKKPFCQKELQHHFLEKEHGSKL